MAKKVQYTTNDPSASTDYLAADNTWKPMTGGGGGVPTTRTLTINGTTQDLSADRTWSVGDMLTSVYDTDVDGVVDSAERIEIVVRNSTGSTLTKGQIVYLSGSTGNRPNALLAKADAEATSSKTIGMVTADILNNADGYIAVNGTLHDINTSAFTAGDMLWLSATTAGGVVANTPPSEPNHTVFIGYVARVHPTQGRVVLAIQNGYELDELHGVQITSVANNNVLKYNSTSGLWENSTISKSEVGLGNVDNTSDLSKPISTATQTALDTKISVARSFMGVNQNAFIGIGTQYCSFIYSGVNTNESSRIFVVPYDCTMKNFYVRIFSAQSITGSLVLTLRNNAVDTSVVVTIAAGSAAGTEANSGATSATFVAGDNCAIKIVNNGTVNSATINNTSIMVEI